MQNRIEGFRLSPQQRRLWFLRRDSPAYCARCAILIEGKLNTEILEEACEKVVLRYEVFFVRPFVVKPGMKTPLK